MKEGGDEGSEQEKKRLGWGMRGRVGHGRKCWGDRIGGGHPCDGDRVSVLSAPCIWGAGGPSHSCHRFGI